MRTLSIPLLIAAGGLALAGCATEKYVNTHVAVVQGQVTDVQGHQRDQDAHLAAQDTHLAALDSTSRDALQRAEAAGKLAEGKFVYSVVLSDDSAHFPVNGAALSTEETSRLTDLATRLKTDNHNVFLEIQGYTDSTGSAAGNLRLGDERAEAVRRYLSRQGVALNRMSTISYGKDDPVAPNKTRAGRAQNRRVVVVVLE